MATKRDRWIDAHEAAAILTWNTDHEVSPETRSKSQTQAKAETGGCVMMGSMLATLNLKLKTPVQVRP